jgi:hypothetical protein
MNSGSYAPKRSRKDWHYRGRRWHGSSIAAAFHPFSLERLDEYASTTY